MEAFLNGYFPLLYLFRITLTFLFGFLCLKVSRFSDTISSLFFVFLFIFFHAFFVAAILLFDSTVNFQLLFAGFLLMSFSTCLIGFFNILQQGQIKMFCKAFIMSFLLSLLFATGFYVLAMLLSVTYIFILLIYDRFTGSLLRNHHYTLFVHFSLTDHVLLIDRLIEVFCLKTKYKSLHKKGAYCLQISYECNGIMQHLFIKRLSRMKGLHFTLSSC